MTRPARLVRAGILAFLAAIVSPACSDSPTGLMIDVRSDGWVRSLELTGHLDDGAEAFPRTTATLPTDQSRGTIVLFVADALAGRRADLELRGFSDDLSSSQTVQESTALVRGTLVDVGVVFSPRLRCGNGLVDADESCDDTNLDTGDGCSGDCQVEPGWTCATSPCRAICGDMIRVPGEACDDGDLESNDGCSPLCTIEPGWSCDGAVCTAVCGDGRLAADETCDDHNGEDGDGCDAECRVELGWDCSSGTCDRVCMGAEAETCRALDVEFMTGTPSVKFGMSPTQVWNTLGRTGTINSGTLPIPGEYPMPENVRYLVMGLPETAGVYTEQDPQLDGAAVFFFKDALLFRVSIRVDTPAEVAKGHVLSFAELHRLPVTEEQSGPHFFVKTSSVLLFGAHNAGSGCWSREPCLELIQTGSPVWEGQRFQ